MPASSRAQIRGYWDAHIHDLEITKHPVGSPGFFADLDAYHFEKLAECADKIAQHLHVDDVPEYFAEQASRMEDLRIRSNQIADALNIDSPRKIANGSRRKALPSQTG